MPLVTVGVADRLTFRWRRAGSCERLDESDDSLMRCDGANHTGDVSPLRVDASRLRTLTFGDHDRTVALCPLAADRLHPQIDLSDPRQSLVE